MDKSRKKELTAQWKERHPEMGVVSVQCGTTGEAFFTTTRDAAGWFNRHRFELLGGHHRNRRLQTLWNTYGEGDFTCAVVSALEYETEGDVTADDLKELLELCLAEHPEARKL